MNLDVVCYKYSLIYTSLARASTLVRTKRKKNSLKECEGYDPNLTNRPQVIKWVIYTSTLKFLISEITFVTPDFKKRHSIPKMIKIIETPKMRKKHANLETAG